MDIKVLKFLRSKMKSTNEILRYSQVQKKNGNICIFRYIPKTKEINIGKIK